MKDCKWRRDQILSGEPITIKSNHMRFEACRDCGLVHLVFYRVKNKNGHRVIERISYRDDYETRLAVKNKGVG